MAATPGAVSPTNDDALTVCAISLLSGMLADVLHEGLGHGAVALITGAQSGVLTTVAWSSAFDSKLVAAGGTLANLAAGIVFWIALGFSWFGNPPCREQQAHTAGSCGCGTTFQEGRFPSEDRKA